MGRGRCACTLEVTHFGTLQSLTQTSTEFTVFSKGRRNWCATSNLAEFLTGACSLSIIREELKVSRTGHQLPCTAEYTAEPNLHAGNPRSTDPWGNPHPSGGRQQPLPLQPAAAGARQASAEVRAGSVAPPPHEDVPEPCKEQSNGAPPPAESWGPFAGLGGGLGGSWQQQWGPTPVDAPPKQATQVPHVLQQCFSS